MTVTFCGHAEVYPAEPVRTWLRSVVELLIRQGAGTFYLGGYGGFDAMAASVLRDVKRRYPEIELVLVLAYLDGRPVPDGYDRTTYPPLESVPKRHAISKRNRWMVEQSDLVIAYVLHDWGGAASTLRYARRKKKPIVLYPQSTLE